MANIKLPGVITKRVKYRRKCGAKVVKTYYTYGKGGARIYGKIGTAEFYENYVSLRDRHKNREIKNFVDLTYKYESSRAFNDLAESTKRVTLYQLARLRQEFQTFSLKALEYKEMRQEFRAFLEKMSDQPDSANRHMKVLKTVLNFGIDVGLIEHNRANGIKLLKTKTRAGIDWSNEQLSKINFLPEHIKLPVQFALWTGQRQGDVLNLKWSNISDQFIYINQSKTDTQVYIYRIPVIDEILSNAWMENKNEFVFLNSKGQHWKSGFGASQRKAFKRAGIHDVHFHDLRGTFENRLRESGCTESEAYSVTGRSMKGSANAYFSRSKSLSKAAMTKLKENFCEQKVTKTIESGHKIHSFKEMERKNAT